jgi:quercetin dioxygenase-like cupin family protein
MVDARAGLRIGLNKGGQEYNRGIMNITRRESLAGAIALFCELGATKVQARAGVKGEPSSPREDPSAESGSATGLESRGGAQSGAASGAQGAERGGADLVFKHDLPNISMDDWEVTVSTVDYAPGRVGKVHHHSGFVLAYVLEGNIVTKISGQEERTYKQGEMFYEPPGSTHEVGRNPSETQPAKLLALIFAKKGAQLTMPGPA